MKIMCDWDLTVAPTDRGWKEYLEAVSGKTIYLPANEKTANYDLSVYVPDFKSEYGIDPFSYWQNIHLYDTMGSVEKSADVLNYLGKKGVNLLVGSVTKGGHISSKFRHVKRIAKDFSFELGSGNGFFATKEKYLLPCDVAIDDRAENLIHFPDNVLKIYLNTIYADSHLEELEKLPNVIVTSIEDPWGDIFSILR